MIIQLNGRLDSWKTLKDKDPLRITPEKFFVFSEDDVMVGYRISTKRGKWISFKY